MLLRRCSFKQRKKEQKKNSPCSPVFLDTGRRPNPRLGTYIVRKQSVPFWHPIYATPGGAPGSNPIPPPLPISEGHREPYPGSPRAAIATLGSLWRPNPTVKAVLSGTRTIHWFQVRTPPCKRAYYGYLSHRRAHGFISYTFFPDYCVCFNFRSPNNP